MLLVILQSSGNAWRDEYCIHTFFRRLEQYKLADCCALLLFENGIEVQHLDRARVYGKTAAEAKELITSADVLWNDCYGIRQPLLGLFRHRVLLDLDPLQYLDLPRLAGRSFELAANIMPTDQTGDRELLISQGWALVDPWEVVDSPFAYQGYIARSRAEILCPKPIYRALRTGWFSDRSACYLASGRPVLAEDTGFTDYLPTGKGLVVFHDLAEAVAGAATIDTHYAEHVRSARQLAEEFLEARRCLKAMLAASA